MQSPTPGTAQYRTARIVVESVIAAIAVLLAFGAWRADAFWFELHGSAFRCVRDAHALSLANFCRFLALVCSLALIFLGRPRLGRLVQREGVSGAAILRYVLAIGLALVASDIILRKPWPHAPPPPPLVCVVCPPAIPNAQYGWKLEPSHEYSLELGGRQVTYSVDGDGNRCRSNLVPRDYRRPTILVGGESIAMGMAIDYDETLSALLEDVTNLQVVDSAAHGYGMDQVYLRETEVAAKYTDIKAIVTLFVPEEAERTELEDRKQLVLDRSGQLMFEPPPPLWIQDIQLRKIWRNAYHSNDGLETMKAIARATSDLAKSRHAYPLFITTNYGEPCLSVKGKPPAIFRTLFDDQQVPRVHVDVLPSDHAAGDPHPGPISHGQIADAVVRKLRDARAL